MINLGDSLMHIFKERRWLVKFGIIFVVQYVFMVFSLLSNTLSKNNTYNLINFLDGTRMNANATLSPLTTSSSIAILVIETMLLIATVIYFVFTVWYTYENLQAAIQKRDSKLIWEYSLGTSLKRILKYSGVSFIYGIFAAVVGGILIVVPILAATIVVSGMSGRVSTAVSSSTITEASYARFGALALILICLACCVFFVLMIVYYMFTIPGYLRFVASNTFGEAFKFGSNFKIAKKYFGYFLAVLLIVFVFAFGYGMVNAISDALVAAVNVSEPVFGLMLGILFQIPLSLVMTYLMYFVYPRLLGGLYSGIVSKEEELKFLRK